jgi:uncharacterized protein YwgA
VRAMVREEEQLRLLRFLDILEKRFDFGTLDHRIEFQKLVYLAMEFDFNFDYSFQWHLHGPYSRELSGDGFSINDSFAALYNRAQNIPNDDVCAEPKSMRQFVEFAQPYVNDSKSLEIAASLVWIRKANYSKTPLARCRDSLIQDVAFVYKTFDPSRVVSVFQRLEQYHVLQ